MQHQTNEKDNKQVVGEPEHLEVWPSDDLHGGSDDEDECQGDDHPGQSCYCCEHHYCWVLKTKIQSITLLAKVTWRSKKNPIIMFNWYTVDM